MTQPVLAFEIGGTRHYGSPDNPLISVTSVLSALAKPFLVPWAVGCSADWVIEHADLIERLAESDAAGLKRMITQARWSVVDKASDSGTLVHEALETWLSGKPVDTARLSHKEKGKFHAVQDFLDGHNIEVVHSEVTIANYTVGYAGTVDMVVRMPTGKLWILDLKAGKGVYPEYAMQVAAYANAECILNADLTTSPWEKPDGGGILHALQTKSNFYPIRDEALKAAWVAFQGLVPAALWKRDFDDKHKVFDVKRQGS